MAKLTGLIVSLLMVGAAHAQEIAIADAPLPEPNYPAIILFLLISVGSCGYYAWKVLRQKKDDDK